MSDVNQQETGPGAEQKAPQAAPVAGGGQDNRSDNLLPGEDGAEDGRFDVAEEVSLDQQSDSARHIGQVSGGPLPSGQTPSEGIADTLPDALKTPPASQPVPGKS